MRHTDLVNAIEALVDSTCADSVKDALAAVCAAKAKALLDVANSEPRDNWEAGAWSSLSAALNNVQNYGV